MKLKAKLNWSVSFWNLTNRVSSREMKLTAGQCPRHGTSLVKALLCYQSSTWQWMAWAGLILLGLDIPFYHSHSLCNLMPGQFSRMENAYFLSVLATMSSISTCGNEGLFSAGLDIPKICSTYFPCSQMHFLLPFYWFEQDCDPGMSQWYLWCHGMEWELGVLKFVSKGDQTQTKELI